MSEWLAEITIRHGGGGTSYVNVPKYWKRKFHLQGNISGMCFISSFLALQENTFQVRSFLPCQRIWWHACLSSKPIPAWLQVHPWIAACYRMRRGHLSWCNLRTPDCSCLPISDWLHHKLTLFRVLGGAGQCLGVLARQWTTDISLYTLLWGIRKPQFLRIYLYMGKLSPHLKMDMILQQGFAFQLF